MNFINVPGGQHGKTEPQSLVLQLNSFSKLQNLFRASAWQSRAHKERCGGGQHDVIVRPDMIRVRVADEDVLTGVLTFARIKPQAEPWQVHASARELNFKCHAARLGIAQSESNPAAMSGS